MPDALDEVLRLVAEGRLTAEDAEPILAALGDSPGGAWPDEAHGERPAAGAPRGSGTAERVVRIVVAESGRTVLNLRVPLALGRFAAARIPGLSDVTAERIRRAVELGMKGPVVESIDAAGNGVRIVIE